MRACFDIGSGSTKLSIVKFQNNTMVELFSDLQEVLYGHNWKINGFLDQDIQNQGINVIQQYMLKIKELKVDQIQGIATEVFRKAKNGQEYIEQIQQKFGFNIQIIDQRLEAELGYLTAKSLTNEDIISYDSGGASFQITTLNNNQFEQINGQIGSSQSVFHLIKNIQNKDINIDKSANPVTQQDTIELINYLKTQIPIKQDWIQNKQVIGIGDQLSLFKLIHIVANKYQLQIDNSFDQNNVQTCIQLLLNKNDQELLDIPQYGFAVPKLCLLYTVMDQLQIKNIKYAQSMGSCRGVFLKKEFWN